MANFASKIGLRVPRMRVSSPTSMRSSWRNYGDDPFGDQEEFNERSKRRHGRRSGIDALMREQRLAQGQNFSQMMQVQKEENDQEKFYVGKWLDLIGKARESGDTTLQKHLINIGEDYIQRLSPGARAMVEPLLRSGPFDKSAQKLKKWDEMNPAPRVTADPETQPYLYAQQLFQAEDYQAERTHLATGQAGQKRNILTIGNKEGFYGMRDDKGRVSLVNEKDLAVQDFAKKYEVSPIDVMTYGGAIGKPLEVNINGRANKQRAFINFPDGKAILETLPGGTAEQMSKHQQAVGDFMAVYSSNNEDLQKKHKLVAAVKSLEDEGVKWEEISDTVLKPETGMNFVKFDKPSWLRRMFTSEAKYKQRIANGIWAESESLGIVAFPGDKTEIEVGGRRVGLYYDPIESTYYTNKGTKLGNYNETVTQIMSELQTAQTVMTKIGEKKKKEKEEEESLVSNFGSRW